MVLLFFHHAFLPTSMWRQIICPGIGCFEVAPSPSGGSCSFLPLGPSRGGPAGIISFYSIAALFHFGNSTASGGLGVECLQSSLDFSGKLFVSSSGPGPSCSGQVSGRTCQQSTQTFDSSGTMLDGVSMASHSSQHVGRCFLTVSHCKRSHHGCFSRPGTQGSAISTFNPLAAQQHVLHRQGFSSSVCQAVMGNTNVYIKGLPAVPEGMGQLVFSTGFTKQCHLCPYTSKFFVTFVSGGTGMAYRWYISFCYLGFFGASLDSQGF